MQQKELEEFVLKIGAEYKKADKPTKIAVGEVMLGQRKLYKGRKNKKKKKKAYR